MKRAKPIDGAIAIFSGVGAGFLNAVNNYAAPAAEEVNDALQSVGPL